MGRVLKQNVFLRKNPPSGEVSAFRKGEELPGWAEDMVGEHLFEDDRDDKPASKEVDRKLLSVPEPAKEPDQELEVPSLKAGVAKWRSFADEAGVNLPAKASRDEIIQIMRTERPELEIPEE